LVNEEKERIFLKIFSNNRKVVHLTIDLILNNNENLWQISIELFLKYHASILMIVLKNPLFFMLTISEGSKKIGRFC
jgi:hypothetical protein